MAISKGKKVELIKQYVEQLQKANSVVVLQQHGIWVNTSSDVRKGVSGLDDSYNVVRKRLFMRALKDAGYAEVDLEALPGSIVVMYSPVEDFPSLKVVVNSNKKFKKENVHSSFTFLGGWFGKQWQDGTHVQEFATMPSKEELVSKLLYLLNYPVQSLAATLQEVAKKAE